MAVAEQPWHRGYLMYALCVIGVLMFSIDGSIVAVALPTMMTDLDTTLPLIAWTLAGYTLAQVALQPAIAKFSDNFGRNRVFLVCVFVFTLSSLLCALAPNIWVLIGCRVLQAMGGSGLLPSATGIVVSAYPARQRERLIGLFSSIIPMGAIIGPNLGGLILTQFSWRGIFLINLPIGLAIMFLLRKRFFLDKPPERQKPIDYPGILLFATSIASLMIALTSLGSDAQALGTAYFWGLLVLSVTIGWLFVRQERRASDPMLDFAIAVRPPFLQVNLYNVLYGMGIFSVMSFVPYFAETRYGMTPAESGLLLTPRSVLMIVTSTVASVWLLKYGYRWPMVYGTAVVTAGLLLIGLASDGLAIGWLSLPPFWVILVAMTLAGAGMGTSAPASNNAGIALMPRQAAAIAGLRAMIRSLGGVLGQGIIVVVMEFAPDRTTGLRYSFVGFGLLLLLSLPIVLTIPDSASALRRKRAEDEADPSTAVLAPLR
ncbi:MAG: MFS transporter [Chloroflexi bacterium]|nr:MFS transporter [Chloroflexota bacterium]